jgi:hypothetical protein
MSVAFAVSPSIKGLLAFRIDQIIGIEDERFAFGVEDSSKGLFDTAASHVCDIYDVKIAGSDDVTNLVTSA